MTLRLALDTSTRLGSVALGEDGRLLGETLLSVRAAHSESAMPAVDRLLESANRSVEELDGIVVGAGPGSFTGVRIAAALARGLCFGLDVPLFAYDSLAAVAAGLDSEVPVCVLFDARRGEVYGAAYRDLPDAALEPVAEGLDGFLERLGGLEEAPAAWRFAGEGAVAHREALEAIGARVLAPHLGHPRAASLLWLADRYPEAGRVQAPADWEPRYVRRSGADRAARREPPGAAPQAREAARPLGPAELA